MSKYINLSGQITERLDVPCGNIRLGIHEALAYLDRYPDQVPGRTITESKVKWMVDRLEVGFHLSDLLTESLQLEIIPDPEPEPDPAPTNAEKLAIYLGLHDLDAITQAGVADFARQLDADGIKAPDANDE